jgi:hypothetical protein
MAPSDDKNADQGLEYVPTNASARSTSKDDMKAATEMIEAQEAATRWVDGTPEEKKLVRKLDWRILPCTWVLYLLGYLDRANIGYVSCAITDACLIQSLTMNM